MAEICEKIAIPQPSVFRILITLHSRGYLEGMRKASIGWRLKFGGAESASASDRLKSLAHSHLQALLGASKSLRRWHFSLMIVSV